MSAEEPVRTMLAAEQRIRALVARNGPISRVAKLPDEFYRDLDEKMTSACIGYRYGVEGWIRDHIAAEQASKAQSAERVARIYGESSCGHKWEYKEDPAGEYRECSICGVTENETLK